MTIERAPCAFKQRMNSSISWVMGSLAPPTAYSLVHASIPKGVQAPACSKEESIVVEARVLFAIGLTILPWASAFAGIRAGLQDYSPAHLTLLRFLVASSVMLVYALLVRMPLPERRDWPAIFGLGFLGITVYHTALNFGQVTVKAGPAALLVAVGPVFVALMSYFFLRERLSAWGWLGIAVAFTGVALKPPRQFSARARCSAYCAFGLCDLGLLCISAAPG